MQAAAEEGVVKAIYWLLAAAVVVCGANFWFGAVVVLAGVAGVVGVVERLGRGGKARQRR